MRLLLLADSFCTCVSQITRLEKPCVNGLMAAAPKTDVVFTPWDGDFPSTNNLNGAARLGQDLYGYLDLSLYSPPMPPAHLNFDYSTTLLLPMTFSSTTPAFCVK